MMEETGDDPKTYSALVSELVSGPECLFCSKRYRVSTRSKRVCWPKRAAHAHAVLSCDARCAVLCCAAVRCVVVVRCCLHARRGQRTSATLRTSHRVSLAPLRISQTSTNLPIAAVLVGGAVGGRRGLRRGEMRSGRRGRRGGVMSVTCDGETMVVFSPRCKRQPAARTLTHTSVRASTRTHSLVRCQRLSAAHAHTYTHTRRL